MASKSPYKGVLTTPINHDEDFAKAFKKRECALMEFFGIDRSEKDAYRRLSILLAMTHVPGFQVQVRHAGRRRKKDQSLMARAQLKLEVEHLRSVLGLSERQACQALSKYKYPNLPAETIRDHVQKFPADLDAAFGEIERDEAFNSNWRSRRPAAVSAWLMIVVNLPSEISQRLLDRLKGSISNHLNGYRERRDELYSASKLITDPFFSAGQDEVAPEKIGWHLKRLSSSHPELLPLTPQEINRILLRYEPYGGQRQAPPNE